MRSNSKHDFMNKSEEGNLKSPTNSHIAGKSKFYRKGGWGDDKFWIFACICMEEAVGQWRRGAMYKRPSPGAWSTLKRLGMTCFCLRKESGAENNSSIHQSWWKEYSCIYLWSWKGIWSLGKHTRYSPLGEQAVGLGLPCVWSLLKEGWQPWRVSWVSRAQSAVCPVCPAQSSVAALGIGCRWEAGGRGGSGSHAEVLGCFPGCALLYKPSASHCV